MIIKNVPVYSIEDCKNNDYKNISNYADIETSDIRVFVDRTAKPMMFDQEIRDSIRENGTIPEEFSDIYTVRFVVAPTPRAIIEWA